MKVYTLNSSYPFGSNMYVIENQGLYAVIDPSLDFKTASLKLGIKPEDVKYIFLTHGHFDHMLCLDSWCDATGLPVSISVKDEAHLSNSTLNCYAFFLGTDRVFTGKSSPLHHGDSLTLGDLQLTIKETPGHTEGSILIMANDSLFVGDTVFAEGGIGRTDLPSGNFDKLLKSIEKIKSFDRSYKVYPGHGSLTTVANIIKGN